MATTARILLIEETIEFTVRAIKTHGVKRIALIGSLPTDKANPKDTDVLITISEDIDLKDFARLSRRLQGRSQGFNRWANIFLVSEQGEYLGRTCPWRDCRSGARPSCQALHCGWRPHLYDDLQNIVLENEVIEQPSIELWPNLIVRIRIPDDLKEYLEKFQKEHLPKEKIKYCYPKDADTNTIKTDTWSNPAAEDWFDNKWEGEPEILNLFEEGSRCIRCVHFQAFNENWGLCFQKASRHYLETIFNSFTCAHFKHR